MNKVKAAKRVYEKYAEAVATLFEDSSEVIVFKFIY